MVVLTKGLSSWGWGVPNTSRKTSLDLSFPSVRWGLSVWMAVGGLQNRGLEMAPPHPRKTLARGWLPASPLLQSWGENQAAPSPPQSPQPRPRWWAERRREALGKTA